MKSTILRPVVIVTIFTLTLIHVDNVTAQPTATNVYGQFGSFSSSIANNDGVSANSLWSPEGVAADGDGNLYVADSTNNRVLFFPAGNTTASRVYGQLGSFTNSTPSTSASTLDNPTAVAVSSSGVFIADCFNNRVLFYSGNSTTASIVYGQSGSFTSNAKGSSLTELNTPSSVAVDKNDNLYVADTNNNRVLFFPAGNTTPTRVYAQDFDVPAAVGVTASGVYIVDNSNHRVLFYPGSSTNATLIYGHGGTPASTLSFPYDVCVDANNNVYIADSGDFRVLYFPAGSTTATVVYGQPSFTSSRPNFNGVTAQSLYLPFGLALTGQSLYVADNPNNRVLVFPVASALANNRPSLMVQHDNIKLNFHKHCQNSVCQH